VGDAPPEVTAACPEGAPVNLDFGRQSRRGYPEAVFCAGKTIDQIRLIAREWQRNAADQQALFTRCSPEQAAVVAAELAGTAYDPIARVAAWPAEPPEPTGGLVVVVAAGTSDLPVAREAAVTVERLGRRCELVVDVGVAGLHRVLARVDLLRSAACVVVVAGMDGALPSVVAGLVSCPVVACPTSVGYGAAFEGLAALLAMLNACAPGVGVVNIDNGYGAGHLAAQIAAHVPMDHGQSSVSDQFQ